jgi:hypothetical protein
VAMDIETMSHNKIQIPVLITCAYYDGKNKIKTFYTLINIDLFNKDVGLSIKDLWLRFFRLLNINIETNSTIFMHNLGNFDGYFVYNSLFNTLDNYDNIDNIQTIIDKDQKFIQITLPRYDNTYNFIWKDSLRIFDVSLAELCEVFSVKGKLQKYDKDFNDLGIFNNPRKLTVFIKYGLQDSVALLEALNSAQNIYLDKYKIDINDIWSISTLSLKIFRKSFLNRWIPFINASSDFYIRKSYYGGATDHYKMYGEGLHHYDVNSLYPHAMCNQLLLNPKYFIKDMTNIKLDDFFGFCLAKIECPKNVRMTLLPYRNSDGSIIFPTGVWYNVYFSEELKFVVKHGYKVNLISGIPFTKAFIFNKYVKHFYEIKSKAVDTVTRFLAKMHLNQLYGYFGRMRELIITQCVQSDKLR